MSSCFRITILMFCFLFIYFAGIYAQKADKYRIMFYNVENFFDINDDTLTDDNSFLPDGLMRWNYSRYSGKLNSLYRTIVAAGEWQIPSIVAMCEVENRGVLQDLIYKTYLLKYSFGIIHEDSPDPRGIDVCLIYNRESSSLISYRYLVPQNIDGNPLQTRSILYSKFLIFNDTLHLIVNHWPSRRGGALAGKAYRSMISGIVKNLCDSISSACRGKIVICGDFNSTPDDSEIRSLTANASHSELINLSESRYVGKGGSYRYRGAWEMIDQFIVSGSLLNSVTGLNTCQEGIRIFDSPFLLEKDPVYPGNTPFRTYKGYRYNGGFSDHLPVLLDLAVH